MKNGVFWRIGWTSLGSKEIVIPFKIMLLVLMSFVRIISIHRNKRNDCRALGSVYNPSNASQRENFQNSWSSGHHDISSFRTDFHPKNLGLTRLLNLTSLILKPIDLQDDMIFMKIIDFVSLSEIQKLFKWFQKYFRG